MSRLLQFFMILIGVSVITKAAFGQRATFERPPIDYLNAPVSDPVAELAKRLAIGEVSLKYEEDFGYLRSVLKELEVPVSSQVLVFSKTSLQLHRISPRRPRALYFNDDVYVGYCQKGDVLELAATDAKQGAIFYTLKQEDKEDPIFTRDRGSCLTCHASSRTQNVPGYLVRSVFSDPAGRPRLGSGTYTTDHTSEFLNRWGGWYVTGQHGKMRHMGNTISDGEEYDFDRDSGANLQALPNRVYSDRYLTPHSDIVALMVLEHQTQMHNALAAANFETRQALHQSFEMNELLDRPEGFVSDSAKRRISSSVDRVLEYLLFKDEFGLEDRVTGTSGFAEEFEAKGVRDSKGRSLRQLDLTNRLLKYPCSYLIYSDAFRSLPSEVRIPVLEKLAQILSGEDEDTVAKFPHLDLEVRRSISQILCETLPEYKSIVERENTAK